MTIITQTPIKLLHPDAKIPVYSSDLAAGCDITTIESAIVQPDEIIGLKRKDITDLDSELVECPFWDREAITLRVKRHPVILRTGIAIRLPDNLELEVRSRSGLGFKYDIIAFNGTIDADYTGELMLKIWNLGTEPFEIKKGMRIAQGVIKQIVQADFKTVDKLEETERGDGGFGHSGL